MGAAPDEQRRPVEGERRDRGRRRDRAQSPAKMRRPPARSRHSPSDAAGGEEPPVGAPGRHGQLHAVAATLSNRRPDAVVETASRPLLLATSSRSPRGANDAKTIFPPSRRIRVSRIAARLERRTSAVCRPGASSAACSARPTLTCGFVGMSASARPASSPPRARRACVRASLRWTRAYAATPATIGQRDEARADDREQAATLAPGADPLAPQLLLGLPGEDRRPEDVVEDLVARRRALHAVDAADDPLAPERLEQPPQLGVLDVGVLGEIGGLVRDLPSRRRDELPHDPCRRLLLGERQPRRALPGRARARRRARRRSRAGSRAAASCEPSSRSRSHSRSSTSWRYGASTPASVDASSSTASTSASSAVNSSPASSL